MWATVLCVLSIGLFAQTNAIKNSNCVAFRLDDIQDWYLNQMQMDVMDVFKVNKTPITVGIISRRFNIGDPKMIKYIQDATRVDGWNFEVCNHGLYHEPFDTYTLQGQKDLLSDAINKTLRDLSGYITQIPTFIPPHNAINQDTITALKSLGFKYLSAMVQTDPGPHPVTGQTFYHWPIESSTADLEYTAAFIGMPWQYTFNLIKKQMNESGFAAVMMHPMEFGSYNSSYYPAHYVEDFRNETMFRELELLLNAVRTAGYEFCTLGNLADKFNNIPGENPGRATTGNWRDGYSGQLLTTASPAPITTHAAADPSSTSSTSESNGSTSEANSSNSVTTSSSNSMATTGFVTVPKPTELWVKQFTVTVQVKGAKFDKNSFTAAIAVSSGLPATLGSFVMVVSSIEIFLPSNSTEDSMWMVIFYFDPSKHHQMPLPPYEVDNKLQDVLEAGYSISQSMTILSAIVMDTNIVPRTTTGYLEPIRTITSASIPQFTTGVISVDNEISISGQSSLSSLISISLLSVLLFICT